VAGTVTLKNAAMLCQLWNVRHLIIKGGIAKITDVNGRIIKRNVREGGVEAPEIIYRSFDFMSVSNIHYKQLH
jgi:hypothetical protein